MPFPKRIEQALEQYKYDKGRRRRIIGYNTPVIDTLKKLPEVDKQNLYKILMCFMHNMPSAEHLSYHVYTAVLEEISLSTPTENLDKLLRLLHNKGFLNQANYDALSSHTKFETTIQILLMLNDKKVLTQAHFDIIVKHNMPEDVFIALYEAKILSENTLQSMIEHGNKKALFEGITFLSERRALNQDTFDVIMKSVDTSSLYDLAILLSYLAAVNLLTLPNITAVKAHTKHSSLRKAIYYLPGLTQEAFDFIIKLNKPGKFWSEFCDLNKGGILTIDNMKVIVTAAENRSSWWCVGLSSALWSLDLDKILTQENFNSIRKSTVPESLAFALNELEKNNILTVDTRDFIERDDKPLRLAGAFVTLKHEKILTIDNMQALSEHDDPKALAAAFRDLNKAGSLTTDTRQLIEKNSAFQQLAEAFVILKEADILTIDNMQALSEHDDPKALAAAFRDLNKAGILTTDTRQLIEKNSTFQQLAEAFAILKEADILTIDNMQALSEHDDPKALAAAFRDLNKAGILTIDTRQLIEKHSAFQQLVEAFVILKEADILTIDNIQALSEHDDPKALAAAFRDLNKAGILTTDTRQLIERHNKCNRLAEAFVILKEADILTQANMQVASEHDDLIALAAAFRALSIADIATVENLNFIIMHRLHENFCFQSVVLENLSKSNLLTQENFNTTKEYLFLHDTSLAFDRLMALIRLNLNNILTQENFDSIVISNNPWGLFSALTNLAEHHMLTAVTRQFMEDAGEPATLAKVFITLNDPKLLTMENMQAVSEHDDPITLATAFRDLNDANLLTMDNMQIVSEHDNPVGLAHAFCSLSGAGLLTKDNSTRVIRHKLPEFYAALLRAAKQFQFSNENLVVEHTVPHFLISTIDAINANEPPFYNVLCKAIRDTFMSSLNKGRFEYYKIFLSLEENVQGNHLYQSDEENYTKALVLLAPSVALELFKRYIELNYADSVKLILEAVYSLFIKDTSYVRADLFLDLIKKERLVFQKSQDLISKLSILVNRNLVVKEIELRTYATTLRELKDIPQENDNLFQRLPDEIVREILFFASNPALTKIPEKSGQCPAKTIIEESFMGKKAYRT